MRWSQIFIISIISLLLVNGALAALEVNTDEGILEIDFNNLEKSEKEFSLTRKITVKNTADTDTTVTAELKDLKSKYDLTIKPESTTIKAKESITFTLEGDIPLTESEEFGNVVFKAGSEEKTVKLSTDVKQMFLVKELDVFANGQKVENIDADGESIKDISPGSEIELVFEIENLFNEDYHYGELQGTITVQVDENDFGQDIDEEVEFSIDPEETQKDIRIAFTVPQDAEARDYDLEITFEAEDENSIDYEEKWTLELEIERVRDDIRLENLKISPSTLACTREARLDFTVVNYGSNSQKRARVTAENAQISLKESMDLSVEEGSSKDNSATRSITFSVDKNVKAGTYPIDITLFKDLTQRQDKESISLRVEDCATASTNKVEKEPEQETKTDNVVVTNTQTPKTQQPTTTTPQPTGNIVYSQEVPFENTSLFLFMFFGAGILVFLVIIFLIRAI